MYIRYPPAFTSLTSTFIPISISTFIFTPAFTFCLFHRALCSSTQYGDD